MREKVLCHSFLVGSGHGLSCVSGFHGRSAVSGLLVKPSPRSRSPVGRRSSGQVGLCSRGCCPAPGPQPQVSGDRAGWLAVGRSHDSPDPRRRHPGGGSADRLARDPAWNRSGRRPGITSCGSDRGSQRRPPGSSVARSTPGRALEGATKSPILPGWASPERSSGSGRRCGHHRWDCVERLACPWRRSRDGDFGDFCHPSSGPAPQGCSR
jgi:hypothetical protein